MALCIRPNMADVRLSYNIWECWAPEKKPCDRMVNYGQGQQWGTSSSELNKTSQLNRKLLFRQAHFVLHSHANLHLITHV